MSTTITVMSDREGAQTFINYRGPNIEDAVTALKAAREKLLVGDDRWATVSMYAYNRDEDVMTSLAYESIEPKDVN